MLGVRRNEEEFTSPSKAICPRFLIHNWFESGCKRRTAENGEISFHQDTVRGVEELGCWGKCNAWDACSIWDWERCEETWKDGNGKVCDEWLFRQIDVCYECKEERKFHERNSAQKQKNALGNTKALHGSANTLKLHTKPVWRAQSPHPSQGVTSMEPTHHANEERDNERQMCTCQRDYQLDRMEKQGRIGVLFIIIHRILIIFFPRVILSLFLSQSPYASSRFE